MPTPTYDLIASNVLGSSAASVTFSSIPATYRDLIVVVTATNASGAFTLRLRLNADTASTYALVSMRGNGSSAESFSQSNTSAGFATFSDMTTYLCTIQIMDYSATDKHKTWLSRGNEASTFTEAIAGRYASTSAVNEVMVFPGSGNFSSGSTFYLYGIVS